MLEAFAPSRRSARVSRAKSGTPSYSVLKEPFQGVSRSIHGARSAAGTPLPQRPGFRGGGAVSVGSEDPLAARSLRALYSSSLTPLRGRGGGGTDAPSW